MSATKELTVGNPLPLIIKFALPLLLGNMLQQTYSMVDAAIVGRTLGINALAAVGASTSVVFLILGFCNGCCGGFAIPIAQKFRRTRLFRHALLHSQRLQTGMDNEFTAGRYHLPAVWLYPTHHAHARHYLRRSLCLPAGHIHRHSGHLFL